MARKRRRKDEQNSADAKEIENSSRGLDADKERADDSTAQHAGNASSEESDALADAAVGLPPATDSLPVEIGEFAARRGDESLAAPFIGSDFHAGPGDIFAAAANFVGADATSDPFDAGQSQDSPNEQGRRQTHSIEDLVLRPGEPVVIHLGPHVPSQYVDRPAIERLGESNQPPASDGGPPTADLSERAKAMLSRTLDGGPPMARPVVLVRLPDDQYRRIVDEVMQATRERDERKVCEVAKKAVHDEFWWRDCQERAITGNY
jgi:hypothetical protein